MRAIAVRDRGCAERNQVGVLVVSDAVDTAGLFRLGRMGTCGAHGDSDSLVLNAVAAAHSVAVAAGDHIVAGMYRRWDSSVAA